LTSTPIVTGTRGGIEMDEQGKTPAEGRKPRAPAILWGIAAALALIALVMDTIENRRVAGMKAIVAGAFTMMAVATYIRTRKP
jgi:hypothetical protein